MTSAGLGHTAAAPAAGALIAGVLRNPAGGGFSSRNPANPGEIVWSGGSDPALVNEAVRAAREALPVWAGWTRERRGEVLRHFGALCAARAQVMAEQIRRETGKAAWDALAEAQLLSGKVDITLDAAPGGPLSRVTGFEVRLSDSRSGRCWFRPHGVMAVVGPFNFPAHLPNGHIVPALLMGNTVVFKPSDKAPAVGQLLAQWLDESLRACGAPPGVVNMVQGGADVAERLVGGEEGVDGVLFTGSWPVGRRIMLANIDRPGRLLALEMGGNNAAIVLGDADLRQAVIECVRSAFVSTGQRCTCTRRIIVARSIAEKFLAAFCRVARAIRVGDPASAPPVFMGPLISEGARRAVFDAVRAMRAGGGEVLLNPEPPPLLTEGWYSTPGVVRTQGFVVGDSLEAHAGADVEVFGPLVRVCVADGLDEAIEMANATRFGLAASIFTRSEEAKDRFASGVRAGCLNINTGTAGASSKLPFGGLGLSGNHRPAGAFSLDYTAYPVAGMVETGAAAQVAPGMSVDDAMFDP